MTLEVSGYPRHGGWGRAIEAATKPLPSQSTLDGDGKEKWLHNTTTPAVSEHPERGWKSEMAP